MAESNNKTLYILGAGFSKACGFPLAAELGKSVIENDDCIDAGKGEFISSNNDVFNRLFDLYQTIKKTRPFEELWISLSQEIQALEELDSEQRTKWWLLKYFAFAIRYHFLKLSNDLQELPLCYSTFFKKLRMEPRYDQSDSILYMNWDTLPEQYCGVCSSEKFVGQGRPFFHPVGATSAKDEIKIAPGILVHRPAGGVHLFELDNDHVLNDNTRKCFEICDTPRIYLETSLDLTRRQQMKIQTGDDLEFMLFPGANAKEHNFTQGQLREAARDLKLSKTIVIIGYQFPKYDNHMRDWFEDHDFKDKKIIVVNPENDEKTFQYAQSACRNGQVSLEKKKFEDSSYTR